MRTMKMIAILGLAALFVLLPLHVKWGSAGANAEEPPEQGSGDEAPVEGSGDEAPVEGPEQEGVDLTEVCSPVDGEGWRCVHPVSGEAALVNDRMDWAEDNGFTVQSLCVTNEDGSETCESTSPGNRMSSRSAVPPTQVAEASVDGATCDAAEAAIAMGTACSEAVEAVSEERRLAQERAGFAEQALAACEARFDGTNASTPTGDDCALVAQIEEIQEGLIRVRDQALLDAELARRSNAEFARRYGLDPSVPVVAPTVP